MTGILLFSPIDLIIFVSFSYLISLGSRVLLRELQDCLVPKTKRKRKMWKLYMFFSSKRIRLLPLRML